MKEARGSEGTETRHLHPHPTKGPWRIALAWRVIGRRPECVGLRVEHLHPGEGMEPLGEAMLRSLNLSAVIARDRASLMTPSARPPAPPPGMKAKTFERLQRVARVYLRAVEAGKPPTKAVAEEFGVAIGTASATVSKARRVGLLPPTSAGVALGEVEPPP